MTLSIMKELIDKSKVEEYILTSSFKESIEG